jgi:hypothetical protein
MGHTNYWQRPVTLPPKHFSRAVADCRRLLPKLGVPLGGAWGTGKPQFGPDAIIFNGVVGSFRETFRIDRESSGRRHGPMVMEFCKTSRLPYDLAVQVALIVFNHHFGGDFRVSSDGGGAGWDEARRICEEQLGYGGDFQLNP